MTQGNMSVVKMKICDHISESDSSLQPRATHVLPSSDEQMWKYDTNNLPIVTVRIGPSSLQEPLMGRMCSGVWGSFVTYFFTAHIFTRINETADEDKTKDAMDLADAVEEYLLRSKDDESGIAYYYEITKRESPSGMAKIAKVIVEGFVYCKKSFSIGP
jgi:hypothetical protein